MKPASLLPLLLAFLLLSVAHSASLVVQPFTSADTTTGVAIAQRVAEAFSREADVYGPAVAPTLVPPVSVAGGFYNTASFLGDADDRAAAALFRSAIGSDFLVTGRLDTVDGSLMLHMNVADADMVRTVVLHAPEDDPGRLARLAAVALAQRMGVAAPDVQDLQPEGTWQATAAAIHFLGTGDLNAASQVLGSQPSLDAAGRDIADAIEAVDLGSVTGDPALLATVALARTDLDESVAAGHFLRLGRTSGLPAAWLWHAQLLISNGQDPAASFDEAGTPYAVASQAAYEGDTDADALVATSDVPGLIALSLLAQSQADSGLEEAALTRLTRVAPGMEYPFERLSFMAFDEERPLDAARALAVATRLAPDSSLYWTNLGWAQYLLGLYDHSELSSLRALVLSPDETVAGFNLGLVRAVTGRLEEALQAYGSTVGYVQGSVDEAAIDDLREARKEHPTEPAVAYSLGWLLEAAGQRQEAAAAYRAYLNLAADGDFRADAERRLAALQAPAAEMELPGGITLLLGGTAVSPDDLYAGDVLTPRFEVYTRGDQLPLSIGVSLELQDQAGNSLLRDVHELNLPPNTVGFVVDGLTVSLPTDLEPGSYLLTLTLTADEDRSVSSSLELGILPVEAGWVHGFDPVRRLLGLSVTMTGLQSGRPLYSREDLGRPDVVLARMEAELALAAGAAEEVMPPITEGRFSGMTGGEAFAAATRQDIADFLAFAASVNNAGATWNFAEAFAQWALDGAP